MKRRISFFIIMVIALLCIGVLGFAITHSGPFNPDTKPAATQAQMKQKLAKNDSSNKSTVAPAPSSPKPATTTPSGQLANTGPGQVVVLFFVSATAGYYVRLRSLQVSAKRYN